MKKSRHSTGPHAATPAALAPLDARGDIAVFRLPSGFNLRESSEKVRDAIALAVAGRRPWLLVDVRANAGESPSAGARHELMREWAGASEGRVRIAVLMQARHIDPERLGVVAAKNFGVQADVFTDESAAAEWLREGGDAHETR